jgi:hypothetical protein
LSQKWNKPLVIDLRDPWDSYINNKSLFFSWLNNKSVYFQKKVYESSSAIISNTNCASLLLKNWFPQYSNKIYVIPNGFDPEDINFDRGPSLYRGEDKREIIHILNLGGFRGGKLEESFLKVVAGCLQDNPHMYNYLKIHFIGATDNKLKNIVMKYNLQDICFYYGVIPTNEIGRPLAEAHIYTLLQPEQFSHSIPSKLFSYLAGGGYIFAMVPDLLKNELLEEISGAKELFFFANEETGKNVLSNLFDKIINNNSRKFYRFPDYSLSYDRRNIAKRFGDVFDIVTN